MRKSLVFGGLMVAGWAFAGCAAFPGFTVGEPRTGGATGQLPDNSTASGEAQTRTETPAQTSNRAAFVRFPAWTGAIDGPLQPVYEEVLKSLSAATAPKCDKPDDRVLSVAKALAPVRALVDQTWKRLADERFEIKLIEADAHISLQEAGLGEVDSATLLTWLVAQAIADGSCKETFDAPRTTLDAITFATSSERVYAAAFIALGQPWQRSTADNPWQGKGVAIQDDSTGGQPGVAFDKVDVSSSGGIMAFGREITGHDRGPNGGGNHIADRGEVLSFSMKIRPRNSGESLISESVLPSSIPPCMVVPWRSVIAPEVLAGGEATLSLPPVLLSDRCTDKASLDLTIQSSWSQKPATLSLAIEPSGQLLIAREFVIDADAIGHSQGGDPAEGITADRRVELRAVVHGARGINVMLASAGAAIGADAPLLGIAEFAPFLMRNESGDELRGIDDLDLKPASATAFKTAIDARSRAIPLTANAERVWVKLTYSAEQPSSASSRARSEETKPRDKERHRRRDGEGAEKQEETAKPAEAETPKVAQYTFVRYVPLKLSTKAPPTRALGF